jgi:hypothetical protein
VETEIIKVYLEQVKLNLKQVKSRRKITCFTRSIRASNAAEFGISNTRALGGNDIFLRILEVNTPIYP